MKKFYVVIVAFTLVFLFVSCTPAAAPADSQADAANPTPTLVQAAPAMETNHEHGEMATAVQGAADQC